ncbi:MAG: AI-2E family transporter [Candidatus Competibacteraceae bacterium]|jgi:predicted PurR-regulated permease PerM|nr:AI-2E family transporter [Candidatus Competibacteraceae bacterium]
MNNESSQSPKLPISVSHFGYTAKAALTVRLALVAILILLFLWYSFSVLLLVFCAIVLAVLLRAVSMELHRFTRISEGLALGIVATGVVLVLAALIALATPTLVDQAQVLAKTIPQAFSTLKQQLSQFGWGQELLHQLDIPKMQILDFLRGQSELFQRLGGVFATTFDVLAAMFIIILMGIYLAAEPDLYINGFLQLFPRHRRPRLAAVLERSNIMLKGWFMGQLMSMSMLGVLMSLGLWVLDVPLAITLGIFTGIMTFIPNFGPLIAGIPAVLLALSVSPLTGLYATILIVLVQNLEGMFITPMIHRNIITLPPAMIIAVQVLLASIYGFIGLLVAMPLVVISLVWIKMLYVEDVLEDGDAALQSSTQTGN